MPFQRQQEPLEHTATWSCRLKMCDCAGLSQELTAQQQAAVPGENWAQSSVCVCAKQAQPAHGPKLAGIPLPGARGVRFLRSLKAAPDCKASSRLSITPVSSPSVSSRKRKLHQCSCKQALERTRSRNPRAAPRPRRCQARGGRVPVPGCWHCLLGWRPAGKAMPTPLSLQPGDGSLCIIDAILGVQTGHSCLAAEASEGFSQVETGQFNQCSWWHWAAENSVLQYTENILYDASWLHDSLNLWRNYLYNQ